MKTSSLKSWATPAIIAGFTISAVTGLLIFFHVTPGLVKPVHEWLSWALVAAAVIHTVANWRQFKGYFAQKPGIAIIATGVLITFATLLAPASGPSGNPVKKISKALTLAPLESVAAVARITPDEAIKTLEKNGLKVTGSTESIREIALQNSRKENDVLFLLFQ